VLGDREDAAEIKNTVLVCDEIPQSGCSPQPIGKFGVK